MIVSGVSPPPRLLREFLLRPLGVSDVDAVTKLGRRLKSSSLPRKGGSFICRVQLIHDAPFATAIGACVLNSLVFPIPSGTGGGIEEEDGGGSIDSADAKLAVMGMISFIPYFNWLSWVFAWMDSSSSRYLVYSFVYLAPYLRTNLSLSPEESWLPIASVFACVLHIQLEASIRNGDVKLLSMFGRQKDSEIEIKEDSSIKESTTQHLKLPPRRGSRDAINEWRIPKQGHDMEQLKQDPEDVKENKSK